MCVAFCSKRIHSSLSIWCVVDVGSRVSLIDAGMSGRSTDLSVLSTLLSKSAGT